VITEGSVHNPLERLEKGAPATWFLAQGDPRQKRKQWIAAMKPKGRVHVDAGAERALTTGSSLLPAGVSAVDGTFTRGDTVEVVAASGQVLGQGLVRYDAQDAARIKRLKTQEIEAVLGYPSRGPLIHRDDLVF
ncbi:MAG: PUA domain-containing protein, partial [Pseudomonadota bacterium]